MTGDWNNDPTDHKSKHDAQWKKMVTKWVNSHEELRMRMTDANTRDASKRKLDWIITNWANVSKPKVIQVEAENTSDHHPIIFKIKLKNPVQKYIKPTIVKSFENYDKEKLI